MDVWQVCSYCYSETVKLSEPHPERPRLWTGGLSVLYCSHDPDWSYTTGSHSQHFPFFQVLFVFFFSAAAWFSPSISLISSSQPFPVISSIQQMFFYPRTQGDVCLDVCLSVIRCCCFPPLLLSFGWEHLAWFSFWEMNLLQSFFILRFRSPHSEHTLSPILPNPAASSVALNF